MSTTTTTTPLQWSNCDEWLPTSPKCLKAVPVLEGHKLAYTAMFSSVEILYPGDIIQNPSVTGKKDLIIDQILYRTEKEDSNYRRVLSIAKVTRANLWESFAPLPERLEEHQRTAALRASNWAKNLVRIQKAYQMPFLKAGITVQSPRTALRGKVLGGLEGIYIAVEFENRPFLTQQVRADLDLIYLDDKGHLLASYER